MTTYQDPPLQSRRAARQNERADAIQHQYPDESTPLQPGPAAPSDPLTTPVSLLYSTEAPPVPEYDAQSFRGRRVAETPEDASPRTEAGYRVRDFSPEARRAALQNWSQPTTTDGALTYQTQQRPPAPVEPTPASDWSAPAEPIQAQAAQAESAPAAAPAYTGDLGGGELPDHTLTRRELRAIREAQGLPPETGPGYADPSSLTSTVPPLVEPAPWTPEQYVGPVQYAAPAEQLETPATITSPSHYTDPVSPSETTSTNDQFSAFEALFGSVQQPATAAPEQEFPTQYAHPLPMIPPAFVPLAAEVPVYEASVAEVPVDEAPAFETLVFDAPAAEVPVYEAPVFETLVFDAPAAEVPVYEAPVAAAPVYEVPVYEAPVYEAPAFEAPVAEVPVTEVPVTTGERPVGHWSRQAELDDEIQFGSAPISREVGIGVTTTSALVLPEIPHHDFGASLTSTGDVLLTGSLDLPRTLSSTGAMPAQLDESSIDHLLDPGDRQVASTDSQPVRAVKAVSTHTSSRGIINAAPPKRGNKMLTTLIISASAMLVVVVGLAVVIVMSGVLK